MQSFCRYNYHRMHVTDSNEANVTICARKMCLLSVEVDFKNL